MNSRQQPHEIRLRGLDGVERPDEAFDRMQGLRDVGAATGHAAEGDRRAREVQAQLEELWELPAHRGRR